MASTTNAGPRARKPADCLEFYHFARSPQIDCWLRKPNFPIGFIAGHFTWSGKPTGWAKPLPGSRKGTWQASESFWMNRTKVPESTLKTASLPSTRSCEASKKSPGHLGARLSGGGFGGSTLHLSSGKSKNRVPLDVSKGGAACRLGHPIDFFVTRPSGVA